jgi:hypothetical protein
MLAECLPPRNGVEVRGIHECSVHIKEDSAPPPAVSGDLSPTGRSGLPREGFHQLIAARLAPERFFVRDTASSLAVPT